MQNEPKHQSQKPPRAGLVEALRLLYTQHFGFHAQWAAVWVQCNTCTAAYGTGGAWGLLEGSSVCPFCHAEKTLVQEEQQV